MIEKNNITFLELLQLIKSGNPPKVVGYTSGTDSYCWDDVNQWYKGSDKNFLIDDLSAQSTEFDLATEPMIVIFAETDPLTPTERYWLRNILAEYDTDFNYIEFKDETIEVCYVGLDNEAVVLAFPTPSLHWGKNTIPGRRYTWAELFG